MSFILDMQIFEILPSLGELACTPCFPVASIESRMTDWQSVPSVGVKSQIVKETAN